GDAEPSMLVGGALVGGGGLVADERRARVEGERLQAGVDDRALVGWAAHHCRPHEEAPLAGLGWRAVAVEVAAVVGVHEDVGAALQFGIDTARRFELEGAGIGYGRAVDAVECQEVAARKPGCGAANGLRPRTSPP